MSDRHPIPGHPPAQEDRVDTRAVALVGAASLAIFFLAGLAATTYLRLQRGEHPALPLPPELGETKIGLVEQRPFGDRLRGERDRAARLAWLEGAGWIDPARGLVHLPIERAMALVAAGVRALCGAFPLYPERVAAYARG